MTDEERLQRYLPLIRNAAGWTAEELGQKIGVTKQTISNLENNRTKMSKTQYLAIQMVISQKIATSTEDLTLANIMKMVFQSEQMDSIDYSMVENAKSIAACEEIKADKVAKGLSASVVAGASAVGGIASAMSLLGFGPVGAVSAAVLGATIAPWLNRALSSEDDETK